MSTLSGAKKNRIHPKMFLLWLGIGSIIMMFAGLTSAYIVREAAGNWVYFKLPDLFNISTLVVILSSITLVLASKSIKKQNQKAYRNWLGLTLILGIAFLILQYEGWKELTRTGILLNGNPSGSFLYVISGIHALHILGGVLFLLIFFIKSLFKPNPVQELLDEINPDKYLNIGLLSVYWHFVDVLWIYLFAFFLSFQQ
ncbi:MAG: cytochrome c oxidase subunit 3 [Chitinophagales bacterium]